MGQEIDTQQFEAHHFGRFRQRLARETRLLAEWMREAKLSDRGPVGGFELEAWLVDGDFAPAAINERFMRIMDDPLVAPELARFNVEFNNRPRALTGRALSEMARELEATWARGVAAAAACGTQLISIGILPTLQPGHLGMDALTPMNRYYALNEQVLRSRQQRPLRFDIRGHERLCCAVRKRTEALAHLRLHNGTVWRWIRPLVGFDDDGVPHVRIEHRVRPGSPSVVDAVSDAALFYGLVTSLSTQYIDLQARLPFTRVRDNFHRPLGSRCPPCLAGRREARHSQAIAG